jgi:hypothetical protein
VKQKHAGEGVFETARAGGAVVVTGSGRASSFRTAERQLTLNAATTSTAHRSIMVWAVPHFALTGNAIAPPRS